MAAHEGRAVGVRQRVAGDGRRASWRAPPGRCAVVGGPDRRVGQVVGGPSLVTIGMSLLLAVVLLVRHRRVDGDASTGARLLRWRSGSCRRRRACEAFGAVVERRIHALPGGDRDLGAPRRGLPSRARTSSTWTGRRRPPLRPLDSGHSAQCSPLVYAMGQVASRRTCLDQRRRRLHLGSCPGALQRQIASLGGSRRRPRSPRRRGAGRSASRRMSPWQVAKPEEIEAVVAAAQDDLEPGCWWPTGRRAGGARRASWSWKPSRHRHRGRRRRDRQGPARLGLGEARRRIADVATAVWVPLEVARLPMMMRQALRRRSRGQRPPRRRPTNDGDSSVTSTTAHNN